MKKFLIMWIIFLGISHTGAGDPLALRDLFPIMTNPYKAEDEKGLSPKKISEFCSKVDKQIAHYLWEVPSCNNFRWQAESVSKNGNPLIYAEIGSGDNVTLVLSGVHPDELNPIPIAFRLMKILMEQGRDFKDQKVVLVPLVNPDGFLAKQVSRTNSNGVDLNRNFNTSDWFMDAHDAWSKRSRQSRYFPGWTPDSEIETQFQARLIRKYSPTKILSLHAPLGIIDYDLDYDLDKKSEKDNRATLEKFAYEIAKNTDNYRIIDFNVYPGSLGNYAGVEKNIPTFTIELTDADPKSFEKHWKNVHKGLLYAIHAGLKLAELQGQP